MFEDWMETLDLVGGLRDNDLCVEAERQGRELERFAREAAQATAKVASCLPDEMAPEVGRLLDATFQKLPDMTDTMVDGVQAALQKLETSVTRRQGK